MLLNSQRENLKIHWDKWKLNHKLPKSMGCSKISSKREVHSDTVLPQEIYLKGLE